MVGERTQTADVSEMPAPFSDADGDASQRDPTAARTATGSRGGDKSLVVKSVRDLLGKSGGPNLVVMASAVGCLPESPSRDGHEHSLRGKGHLGCRSGNSASVRRSTPRGLIAVRIIRHP